MGYRLGVDVGGTFTDVQMQDTASGELTLVKVLSTPEDQSVGVLAGIEEACQRVGATPKDLDQILHGSTVVTNLILESKGAKGGLLTTKGNEQILHLARAWTPGPLYGWMGMIKPPPLVRALEHPRHRRPDRGRRLDRRGAGRGRGARGGGRAGRRWRAVRDRRIPQLVREPRARAPRARHRPRGPSRAADLDLLRPRARVPRVRAHAHRRAERLRAAAGHPLRGRARAPAARRRLRQPARDRALRRRHDELAVHQGAPGGHRLLRTVRRRGRRGLPGAPHRGTERADARRGRHLHRRVGVRGRRRDDQARRGARLLPVPVTRS